jgi:bifunctional DNA-binding transcriptional regulator/antitoxin component of YhaV-PrlF toxin-antitoxin module
LTKRGDAPTLKTNRTRAVLLGITITVKDKIPLVVPNRVRREAGFKSGDRVEFGVSRGVVTILPKPSAAGDNYTPAERRAIERGIAQSEKEYREGRSFGPFDTHEAFIASLHRESARPRRKKSKRPAE